MYQPSIRRVGTKINLTAFLNNSSRVLLQTQRRFILHYEMCWQVKLTLKFLIKFWTEGVQATKGNPGLNKMWSDARELARTDPEGAELMVATRIATLPGGKDYFATMKTRGEEARAAALQPGKIKELADKVRFQEFEGFQNLAEAGVDIMAMVADDSEIRGPLQQIAKRQGQLNLAERAGNARAAEKLELEIANLKDAAQEKAQTKVNDVSNALVWLRRFDRVY